MNQYAYDGPVMEFENCVAHRWKSTTRAVSEKKARSNLVYQFKKQHNRLPNTRITLPGKLIAAGERRKQMEEYKPNSHKSKEEQRESDALPEKKVGKVITGSAKPKKKGEMQKFADVFISEDVGNVKSYIIMEVLVPAVKKAISDIVTNGIDMILYGETGHTKKNPTASKVSYGKFYDRDSDRRRDYRSAGTRGGYDYDDIIFETRGDAESVLDAMNDIISQYGVVSVGDLYDLADVSTNNYAVNKYGWTDISGCKPVRVRDGYILKLPKALPLN